MADFQNPVTNQPPAREPVSAGDQLMGINNVIERGLSDPGGGAESIRGLQAVLGKFQHDTGSWPSYLDVGVGVFYDVYDYHVRRLQPIRITKMAEQRIAIQFMFTQLILRWEVPNPGYMGRPY